MPASGEPQLVQAIMLLPAVPAGNRAPFAVASAARQLRDLGSGHGERLARVLCVPVVNGEEQRFADLLDYVLVISHAHPHRLPGPPRPAAGRCGVRATEAHVRAGVRTGAGRSADTTASDSEGKDGCGKLRS